MASMMSWSCEMPRWERFSSSEITSGVMTSYASLFAFFFLPAMLRFRSMRGAPNSNASASVVATAYASPFLTMSDACASASEGASMAGNPKARTSSLASPIMSLVSRVPMAAYFFMDSRSSTFSASWYFFSAASLTALRCCSTCFFSAGGSPSNTNASLMLCCMRLDILLSSPMRWDVTFPLESVRREPSRCLIELRNWYSHIGLSTTSVLPRSSSREISFFTSSSVKATPMASQPVISDSLQRGQHLRRFLAQLTWREDDDRQLPQLTLHGHGAEVPIGELSLVLGPAQVLELPERARDMDDVLDVRVLLDDGL